MSVAYMSNERVLFATDIPPKIDSLLQEAVALYPQTSRAEEVLWLAYNMAPDRLEVYVALYKFYFYKKRLKDAEEVVNLALHKAAELGGFSPDWNVLNSSSSQWSPASDAQRFYLYTLKALAFISLRVSNLVKAKEVLEKLQELDPTDQVGGSVVADLLAGSLESTNFGSRSIN